MAEQTVDAPAPPARESLARVGPGVGARTTLLIGALLACGIVAFELTHLPVPFPSDQINYFHGAEQFPTPHASIPVHQYARFGLVIPMRLAIAVLGPTDAAYNAVPIVAGLVLALAVYALGVLLFSRAVGVAAAAVTVGNNLIFHDLLQPLPDVLSAGLFCWALVLTIAIRDALPSVSSTRSRRIPGLLGVGALLGWSYLTREYSVFAWPLVPALLWRRVGWRGLLWVALPLAATGAVELVLSAAAYGDPLARVRAVSGHGSQGPPPDEAFAATFQNKPRSWYLTRLLWGINREPEALALLALLSACVAAGVLLRKRFGLLLAWTAMVYSPLVMLGGLLDPAQPMLRLIKMRYWLPLLPAFIIGGLGAVWWLGQVVAERLPRLRQRTGLVAGAAVLVVAAGTLAPASLKWERSSGYNMMDAPQLDELRNWLRANGGNVDVIWTDRRTARILPLYFRQPFSSWAWRGEVKAIEAGGAQPQPGDYVVMYSTKSQAPCSHCRTEMQLALGSRPALPAASLRPVFATADEQLLIYQAT